MQLARDFSIQVYCEFYPSHQAGTHLTTDHHRIGVFYHPYDTRDRQVPFESLHLPKSGRMPVSYWRHVRNAEARYRQSQGLERTRFSEFSDYESAYGGTSTPFSHARAYQPSGLSMLPPVVAAVATPLSDPGGYVNSMLDAFGRFYDPVDALTRDDWNLFVDLNGSFLGAQYGSGFGPDGDLDINQAMLNARAHRLKPENLEISMRFLAEKIADRVVIESKTPAQLGITAEGKQDDLDYYDGFIGQMLRARREYVTRGDIDAEDEMFAGFDSKEDPDETVNNKPPLEQITLTSVDLKKSSVILQKLKTFLANTAVKPKNETDKILADLEALKKATQGRTRTAAESKKIFELSRQYALQTSLGFVKTRQIATTRVQDFERARAAIVKRADVIDNRKPVLAKEITALEEKDQKALDKYNKQKNVENLRSRNKALRELEAAKLEMKTLETNYQKEVQLNQTLKLDMVEYAESLNKKDEEYDIPRGARRALQLKRGTEFYERAVSLITVDLVEKELASMKFAKQAEGTKNVEDAISIIENVRLQLPDNSIHELTRVAGRGSLPFALSSTSSSLAVADVVDTRKYNSQTQAAIAELLR